MKNVPSSRPEPRTVAEYKAAIAGMLAEMACLNEQMERDRGNSGQRTADEILASRPEPKTSAEYKAAIAELLAEIDQINERMNRNRPEIERLKEEFTYLAVLMDVFSRSIRGWNLGRGLEQELTLVALRRAMGRGTPEIHHSDQGVQYAATKYVERLSGRGVAVSMAGVGKPEENGYAERLMRTIKEEEVALTEYADFADARRQLGRFLDAVYNRKRIHSALGYLTPTEFEQQWRAEKAGSPTVQ